jgi:glycerophosphoryl diester phosphodiesterase
MSFDPTQIVALAAAGPRLTRGIVAESWSGHLTASHVLARGRRAWAYGRDLLRAQPQFLAYSVKDLPATLPLAARNVCRMPLLTWTVRTEDDRRRAARFADQMIFEGFRP